ncbi:hypothetical protein [Plantactinospora endophytica]|uniref:Uncharacterized protein n=1 Tax=Plantactinospora endophytica TaxID=673535 RepID=A0ABQ4E6Y4_9ACTN|nr:hypothetical protein [Plantactinospora endophytica]GIG90480.1 hypothetical protein Pen02_54160 [Plantactinospora endophytica]
MTMGPDVIDLDVPGDGPRAGEGSAGAWGGRRAALHLVAVFVFGVALGGVGGDELWKSRQERAGATLVAMPGAYNGGVGSVGDGTVRLDAQLVLVNAGSAPITVWVDGARGSGVVIGGTDRSWLVRPGGMGWVDVEVTLECATAFAPEPLDVSFSVETADRRRRQVSYPIALLGSPWQQMVQPVCEHLSPARVRGGPGD